MGRFEKPLQEATSLFWTPYWLALIPWQLLPEAGAGVQVSLRVRSGAGQTGHVRLSGVQMPWPVPTDVWQVLPCAPVAERWAMKPAGGRALKMCPGYGKPLARVNSKSAPDAAAEARPQVIGQARLVSAQKPLTGNAVLPFRPVI